jgi:hypothetical protein
VLSRNYSRTIWGSGVEAFGAAVDDDGDTDVSGPRPAADQT